MLRELTNRFIFYIIVCKSYKNISRKLPIIPFALDKWTDSKANIETLRLYFFDKPDYVTSSAEIILEFPNKVSIYFSIIKYKYDKQNKIKNYFRWSITVLPVLVGAREYSKKHRYQWLPVLQVWLVISN